MPAPVVTLRRSLRRTVMVQQLPKCYKTKGFNDLNHAYRMSDPNPRKVRRTGAMRSLRALYGVSEPLLVEPVTEPIGDESEEVESRGDITMEPVSIGNNTMEGMEWAGWDSGSAASTGSESSTLVSDSDSENEVEYLTPASPLSFVSASPPSFVSGIGSGSASGYGSVSVSGSSAGSFDSGDFELVSVFPQQAIGSVSGSGSGSVSGSVAGSVAGSDSSSGSFESADFELVSMIPREFMTPPGQILGEYVAGFSPTPLPLPPTPPTPPVVDVEAAQEAVLEQMLLLDPNDPAGFAALLEAMGGALQNQADALAMNAFLGDSAVVGSGSVDGEDVPAGFAAVATPHPLAGGMVAAVVLPSGDVGSSVPNRVADVFDAPSSSSEFVLNSVPVGETSRMARIQGIQENGFITGSPGKKLRRGRVPIPLI